MNSILNIKNKLLNQPRVQSLINFMTINKKHWKLFGKVFIAYTFWYFLPYFFSLAGVHFKSIILKMLYDFIKDFFSVFTTGMLFYLTVETLIENSKIKHELDYIIYEYRRMKEGILWAMILAKNGGLVTSDTKEIFEKSCYNPIEANKCFTQDVFSKIISDLDARSLRTISRSIQFFLERFSEVSYTLLQNGDPSLVNVFNNIKNVENVIEEYLACDERYLAWSEEMIPKCEDPLYLLFCKGDDAEDPLLKTMISALRKYY